MKVISFIFVILISLNACSKAADVSDTKKTVDQDSTIKVFVFKPNGSLQCESGKGMSAEEMQKQLEKIKVFASRNKSDGLMHAQMCGSPTGMINVYMILQKDLSYAISKGFELIE